MNPKNLEPNKIKWAWRLGEFGYRLRETQKRIREEFLACHSSQKYYVECSRRLGKSTFILFLLVEHAIKYPRSKCGFYAPVKEGLRDYILPLIDKVINDCPDDLMPVLDSKLTWTFPNGSTIIFRGSNNQQHRVRRGNDLNLAAIDEARDVDDLDNLIESVVLPSLFTTKGRILISSTPADSDDHPLKQIRDDAERNGWMSRYTIMDANKYDAKDFPIDKINIWEKETLDKTAWQREYLCQWVKDPTRTIIPEWSDQYAVSIIHDEYFQWYHKYTSIDSGVTDKTAILFGYYDFRRAKLIIESEAILHGEEVRTDRIAELVKEHEHRLGYQLIHDTKDNGYKMLPDHEKVKHRIADNDNLILIHDLNNLHDLNFFATAKDDLDAQINNVREMCNLGKIIVDKSCIELLGCLRNAQWDKSRKKLAKSKAYGHFDALMALVYLVRNLNLSTNPIPPHAYKSFYTHAIPMDSNMPVNQAEKLAKIFFKPSQREISRRDFAKDGY